jgi:hypothetical protein
MVEKLLTIFLKPQNALYQGLMVRLEVHPRKRLGLYRDPETEVVFRRPLKHFKGKSEITSPSQTS